MKMTSIRKARLAAGQLMAASTLLFSSIYFADFYDPGLPGLAAVAGKGVGLLSIFLSIAAFVVSLRIKSPAIAGMLVAGGVAMQVPPVQAIAEAGAIAVPGPILGVNSFAPVLAIGLVKAYGLRKKGQVGAA